MSYQTFLPTSLFLNYYIYISFDGDFILVSLVLIILCLLMYIFIFSMEFSDTYMFYLTDNNNKKLIDNLNKKLVNIEDKIYHIDNNNISVRHIDVAQEYVNNTNYYNIIFFEVPQYINKVAEISPIEFHLQSYFFIFYSLSNQFLNQKVINKFITRIQQGSGYVYNLHFYEIIPPFTIFKILKSGNTLPQDIINIVAFKEGIVI